MEKVYVVIDPDYAYEEIEIKKVFLVKEYAEKYIKDMKINPQNLIESIITDKPVEIKNYWFTYAYNRGPIYHNKIHVSNVELDCCLGDCKIEEYFRRKDFKIPNSRIEIGVIKSFISEEHCIDLAKKMYSDFLEWSKNN